MIPFLGAGANLCDRGDEAWDTGQPVPAERRRARRLSRRRAAAIPTRATTTSCASRSTSARRAARTSCTSFSARSSVTTISPPRCTGCSRARARLLADDGQAATARGDDELRRPARACARRRGARVRRRLVRGEAQLRPRAGASCTGRRARRRRRSRDRTSTRACRSSSSAPRSSSCTAASVARAPSDDSYVVTEDSYIDYLSGGDVGALIPIALWQRMTSNSLLFLGYSLNDWNLRVILNRIWGTRKLVAKSWAMQREPSDPQVSKIEQTLWDARENVELVYCELSEYVQGAGGEAPAAGGGAAGRMSVAHARRRSALASRRARTSGSRRTARTTRRSSSDVRRRSRSRAPTCARRG